MLLDLPSRFDVSALKRINLTVLSLLPVAISCPSGVHARQYIEPLWCFVLLKRTVGWYVWWSSLKKIHSSISNSFLRLLSFLPDDWNTFVPFHRASITKTTKPLKRVTQLTSRFTFVWTVCSFTPLFQQTFHLDAINFSVNHKRLVDY